MLDVHPVECLLSLNAFSAFYGMSPAETSVKLSAWLRSIGVAAVLDVSDGRDFSLLETAAEFIERYFFVLDSVEMQYGVLSGRGDTCGRQRWLRLLPPRDGSQVCRTVCWYVN